MIRRLVGDDAAAAAALIREAFAAQDVVTDPPSAALRESSATVAAEIAAGGGACAELGGGMVGAILWRVQASGLYLGRLAVRPGYRRQGLGRALVEAAEVEARQRGLARLCLGARIPLLDNRRLFASCGFVEMGFTAHAGYAAPTSVQMEKRLGKGEVVLPL